MKIPIFSCYGHFFHAVATERYQRSSISYLTLQAGRVISDHSEKTAELWNAFKGIMGVSTNPVIHFNLEEFIRRVDGLEVLTAPFI